MNKTVEFFRSLGEKWKALSKTKKITAILITSGIVVSLIIATMYATRVQYATLFSNLEPQDSAKIIDKLKNDKVPYKVEGTTILVPKDQADELRMSAFSDGFLPSEKGFELFDQSKFGVTDTEAKIMYQRALEGELARTIESLDGVDRAMVHLVLPEDSVFARDTEKATASVTLKLSGINTLSPERVKAIVALVSGSVKNLPRENVEVVDSNMNLLSEGLFDDTTQGGTPSAVKQQELEKQFEGKLQNDVKGMLESIFGRNKVKVNINADLDFDSKQITTITYDKNDVVERSTKETDQSSTDSGGSSGAGGVNANVGTQYPATSGSGQSSNSTNTEKVTNNEIGQTEQKIIKAPGEVKRMTVSVVIDGNLSDAEKTSIRNIVAAATGFDQNRQDVINIDAMAFNSDYKKNVEDDLKKMQEDEAKAKSMRTYALIGAGSLLAIALIVFIVLGIRKRRRNKLAGNAEIQPSFDVVVGDEGIQPQLPDYKPVLNEDEENMMTLEKELQGYANKKPEQVAEVIRTWLSEDER